MRLVKARPLRHDHAREQRGKFFRLTDQRRCAPHIAAGGLHMAGKITLFIAHSSCDGRKAIIMIQKQHRKFHLADIYVRTDPWVRKYGMLVSKGRSSTHGYSCRICRPLLPGKLFPQGHPLEYVEIAAELEEGRSWHKEMSK